MNKIVGKVVGNTTATPMPIADWNQTDEKKADFIKNKPDIDSKINGVKNDITELQKNLNGKADKSNLEALGDTVGDVQKNISTLNSSANAFLNHDSNENIHVNSNDRANWNGADKKFALVENGIIEVPVSYKSIDELPVFTKLCKIAEDFYDAHPGVFRVTFDVEEDGYSKLEKALLIQTYNWESHRTHIDDNGENEVRAEYVAISQTLCSGNKIYTRVLPEVWFNDEYSDPKDWKWHALEDTMTKVAEKCVDKGTEATHIVETAEGSAINMTNSANAKLKGLKVFGKTTQHHPTGAQLLPYPYSVKEQTHNGVTFSTQKDGGVRYSGTPTASAFIKLYDGAPLYPTKDVTYSIQGDASNLLMQYTLYDANDAYLISANVWIGTPITINISAKYPEAARLVITLKTNSTGVTTTGTAYPMLNLGTTWLPYEPYTDGKTAPSVEYPQELISVGNSGSIITKAYEKNLLDISVNPILVKQEDGSYVNKNGKIAATKFPLDLPYGSYTFSCDIKSPVSTNARIRISLKDGSYAEDYETSTGAFVHFEKDFIGEPINWYINYNASCDIGTFVIKNAQLETGSVVTDYEPYKEPQTFTLNTPNGLAGLPVTSGGNYTDKNGQQWICDEIDLARGKYVQRVGKYEVTGNEKWEFHSSSSSSVYYRYDCTVSVPANIGATNMFDPLCMCTHYRTALNTSDASSCCWVSNKTSTTNEAIGLRIRSTITSVNEFTQMLKSQYSNESSVTFYYILATPIETDLNLTEDEIEQYKALTTHKPVTNIYNDADAHMKVDYVADPKNYIDNKFANIENAILSLGGNV